MKTLDLSLHNMDVEAIEAARTAWCEEIHDLAERLGDQDLADYMSDGEAMAKNLRTPAEWIDLLNETRSRFADLETTGSNQ